MEKLFSSSLSVTAVIILLVFLAFVEESSALPNAWGHGLLINRRPEVYYDSEVVDRAYILCWMEIQKDILKGRTKRFDPTRLHHPKWIPIADGRAYYLPYSERQKLSLGDSCLLEKGIQIARLLN
ncbi:unnamed protein product [Hydatigera taeniaeformis]|uniref:Uncharacterized protein n=1 Tax=Hydatigena taeniaeformis TaxID=6205 RepID=A0A0R3X1M7_HYDTA|nr:unnamed protein product [Hydatigera taeniaeformis]